MPGRTLDTLSATGGSPTPAHHRGGPEHAPEYLRGAPIHHIHPSMDGSLFTFFHSLLRYGALLTILLAGVLHLRGYLARRPILNGERSLAIIAVVMCHIQLAIGLLLYFTTKSYALDSSSAAGRFWKMEHIGVMVIAIILVIKAFAFTLTKQNSISCG